MLVCDDDLAPGSTGAADRRHIEHRDHYCHPRRGRERNSMAGAVLTQLEGQA
jgi:hypothetical protein